MSLPEPPTLTRCYRHPDREAGRRCTRCGKSACSDCLVQAAVGSHCLDCVKKAQPDIKTRVKYANAKQATLVTNIIIGINVAVFVWVAAGDTSTLSQSIGRSDTISQRQIDLGLNKALLRGDFGSSGKHEWYRLVTSGFLHFGILHIALNMWLLYLLGQLLERSLGRTKFALLYMAALLGGSLGELILSTKGLAGGASGAVFGLMGAAALAMHRQGVNIFQTGIGRTLILNLVLTFLITGISVGGHIGGLVAGGICGFVMMAPKWKPVPQWATYAAPVAVSVLAVALSIAVVG